MAAKCSWRWTAGTCQTISCWPARTPGKVAARAAETLEQLLEKITPTVDAVSEWVRARSPDECGVEFGLKLGGETGVIVAKGTAEVNFVVKLAWKKTQ